MQWVNSTEENRGVNKRADRGKEVTQSEQQKENNDKNNPQSLRKLWDYKTDLTFVSLDSQERKRKGSLKN